MRGTKHAQQHEIAEEPEQHRQREPGVGAREQQQRAGAVDQDVPDGGDRARRASRGSPGRSASRDWRCGRRNRSGRTPSSGAPHANGSASGCGSMTLAAIAWLAIRFCAVSASGRSTSSTSRHRRSSVPVFGEQRRRRGRGDERDDAPDEDRDRRCRAARRMKPATNSADEQPLGLPGEMPIERDQPGRRLRAVGRGGRLQQPFKQREHGKLAKAALARTLLQGANSRRELFMYGPRPSRGSRCPVT